VDCNFLCGYVFNNPNFICKRDFRRVYKPHRKSLKVNGFGAIALVIDLIGDFCVASALLHLFYDIKIYSLFSNEHKNAR